MKTAAAPPAAGKQTAAGPETVLFDLDNTLLKGDSDFAWGQFLCEVGAVDARAYEARNREFYQQYEEGKIDIRAYLEFALAPLARHPPAKLRAWRDAFVRDKIRPMVTQAARDLVAGHRDRGDTTAIVTSTNRFVVAPIAKLFEVDALLATEPVTTGGRHTGGFEEPPCFREGKIEWVRRWLARARPPGRATRFYSDSLNDLPLLEWVDHPVVANGDAELARIAAERGWPSIALW